MKAFPNLGACFHEVVQQHAERTALLYPATGEQVSYRELSILVDQAAERLRARGLRAGQVAAIFHDKSPLAFATMLACLRLGIIYTNLDPDSPWERLRKILSSCEPALIINAFPQLPCAAELAAAGYTEVLYLRELEELADPAAWPEEHATNGSSPAYIMFTSGSTGVPKGAVMSHANLMWFIAWAHQRFAITQADVLTNVNPMYFDNSVFDFYAAIFAGAALVPVSSEQLRDARGLVRLVSEAGCTIWFSVPTLLVYLLTMRALITSSFPKVRKIIFGGEGFPKARLRQLYDLFGGRAELENVYGPTECTCICSAYTIIAEDFSDMQGFAPLGRLSSNFTYEIQPAEHGSADSGELLLYGPQVGLGYYNDGERTSRSFVQNPQHSRYADIGYRTGDLVRSDESGMLHFKGRADFQIKHMGYRIELEEIESALGTFPDIRECAVIYDKLSDELGQIIAYVALDDLGVAEDLRNRLRELVPPYMLPRRFVCLDALPKNANGKIDRVALRRKTT